MSLLDSHFALKQTVAPTEWPISVSEAKKQCRITLTDEDDLIQSWIIAATKYCEGRCRKQFMPATWRLSLDRWPCYSDENQFRSIEIPRPPLQSVTSITYVDETGTIQTWASSNYRVDTDSEPGRISPAFGVSYPSHQSVSGAIAITYLAGYTSAALVSENEKQAIRMRIACYNQFRGDEEMPEKVKESIDDLLMVDSIGDLVY